MPEWVYLLLFLAGFAGGLIDSIAGGGGLITVPALLATGMPPQLALGTNKLQSACGTMLAVYRFARAGMINTPRIGLAIACSFFASMGGAWAVTMIDPAALGRVIPWLLAAVAIYTAANRKLGLQLVERRVSYALFAVAAGMLLGFYDGFFGPGTGSFWTLGLVTLLGMDLRGATGYTKAVNLASNLGSLVVFVAAGSVNIAAAGAMAAGQLLGARIGSGLVIHRGSGFIRPVFLTVVFAMTLKLIYDAWFR